MKTAASRPRRAAAAPRARRPVSAPPLPSARVLAAAAARNPEAALSLYLYYRDLR